MKGGISKSFLKDMLLEKQVYTLWKIFTKSYNDVIKILRKKEIKIYLVIVWRNGIILKLCATLFQHRLKA